jgi:hypothetical protein
LDRLAKRLVEIETLEGDILQQLLDGQEPELETAAVS